jgi:hypothetical protein
MEGGKLETTVLKEFSQTRDRYGKVKSVLRVVQYTYSIDGRKFAPALELREVYDKDGDLKVGKVKGLRLADPGSE